MFPQKVHRQYMWGSLDIVLKNCFGKSESNKCKCNLTNTLNISDIKCIYSNKNNNLCEYI